MNRGRQGVPQGGGATVPDQALAVPVEPVSRLDPAGFDPSREALNEPALAPLNELRAATTALIIAVEQDSVADWPGDVDYSHLDRAWAAIDATFPRVWTDEQVAAVEAWQACGWVHPLTCINRALGWHKDEDGDEVLPVATPHGLVCRSCGFRQMSVPDCVFLPLPPNPAEYFASAIEAMRHRRVTQPKATARPAKRETPMTDRDLQSRIGHDIGDFCDRLLNRRHTQEHREAGEPNKQPASNSR